MSLWSFFINHLRLKFLGQTGPLTSTGLGIWHIETGLAEGDEYWWRASTGVTGSDFYVQLFERGPFHSLGGALMAAKNTVGGLDDPFKVFRGVQDKELGA
jgi:hypothetical protein